MTKPASAGRSNWYVEPDESTERKSKMEEISFQKDNERYLDMHPKLNWETRYSGSNGSSAILRSVNQLPDTFFINLETIGSGDEKSNPEVP